MTTAHRPTFDTARGGKGKWEGDLSAMSKQYSSRDLPGHTRLKYRQEGQGTQEELRGRDLKRDLEERERVALRDKERGGSGKEHRERDRHERERERHERDRERIEHRHERDRDRGERGGGVEPLSIGGSGAAGGSGGGGGASRERAERAPRESKRPRWEPVGNLDADDPQDEEEDTDSEDEDDTAALMAELAKIKKERALELSQREEEKRAEEERIRTENILKGNPLMNGTEVRTEFKVKRRWDDDVVFKNCSRGLNKDKGFINDTLRSEFHKRFMNKYIK